MIRFLSACAIALTVAAVSPAARADAPDTPTTVRNAVVAMSLADAAMPYATAVSVSRDDRAQLAPASAALKPETAVAMAAMRPVSVRSAHGSYERRVRAVREFPLMLGVAY